MPGSNVIKAGGNVKWETPGDSCTLMAYSQQYKNYGLCTLGIISITLLVPYFGNISF